MRPVTTEGNYQILESRTEYVIKRIRGAYSQHGHIRKGRGKNKGFKNCKLVLTLIKKGILADSKYLRECQRRLLTPEEYDSLRRHKKKLKYRNVGGRRA